METFMQPPSLFKPLLILTSAAVLLALMQEFCAVMAARTENPTAAPHVIVCESST
jgi:hypothetical protein